MTDNKIVADTEKRRPPSAGRGRKKGALNKTTRTVKEAITLAADALGGAERLAEWAREDPLNERTFWATIYPKLLPLQIADDKEQALQPVTRVEIVAMLPEGKE